MFSAFSSTDYHSIRAKTPAETAVKRLNGIGEVWGSASGSWVTPFSFVIGVSRE